MKLYDFKYIYLSVGLILLILLIFINYDVLTESYGSGAPYYGGTTNMDKWENPMPMLVLIDSVGGIIIFLLFRLGLERNKLN